MKKLISLLLLIFVICGCTQQPTSKQMPRTLEHSMALYVAMSQDMPVFQDNPPYKCGHIHDDERFSGTGAYLTSVLKDALTPYASHVILGSSVEPLDLSIANAKAQNARYVFAITDLDICLRRRIISEPRIYTFIAVIKVFDTLQENDPGYSVSLSIHQPDEPAFRTKKEVEHLRIPINDYAKLMFEGVRQ